MIVNIRRGPAVRRLRLRTIMPVVYNYTTSTTKIDRYRQL